MIGCRRRNASVVARPHTPAAIIKITSNNNNNTLFKPGGKQSSSPQDRNEFIDLNTQEIKARTSRDQSRLRNHVILKDKGHDLVCTSLRIPSSRLINYKLRVWNEEKLL